MGRPRKSNGSLKRDATKSKKVFPLDRAVALDNVQVLELAKKKKTDKESQSRLVLDGLLTPDTANVFGLRQLLFTEGGLPKEGYKSLQLDIGKLAQIHLKTGREYAGTPLDLRAQALSGFTVRPLQGRLRLRFKALIAGYAQQLSDFQEQVGDGFFELVLEPLQGELYEPVRQPDAQAVTPVTVTRMQ